MARLSSPQLERALTPRQQQRSSQHLTSGRPTPPRAGRPEQLQLPTALEASRLNLSPEKLEAVFLSPQRRPPPEQSPERRSFEAALGRASHVAAHSDAVGRVVDAASPSRSLPAASSSDSLRSTLALRARLEQLDSERAELTSAAMHASAAADAHVDGLTSRSRAVIAAKRSEIAAAEAALDGALAELQAFKESQSVFVERQTAVLRKEFRDRLVVLDLEYAARSEKFASQLDASLAALLEQCDAGVARKVDELAAGIDDANGDALFRTLSPPKRGGGGGDGGGVRADALNSSNNMLRQMQAEASMHERMGEAGADAMHASTFLGSPSAQSQLGASASWAPQLSPLLARASPRSVTRLPTPSRPAATSTVDRRAIDFLSDSSSDEE